MIVNVYILRNIILKKNVNFFIMLNEIYNFNKFFILEL